MIAPPAAPWNTRVATSIGIEPAAAAASEEAAKANVAHLNTLDVPTESMNEPAMAVVTPEASRKAVITHGRRCTWPSSAVRSGKAAVTARPSKATMATVVKMATDAGNKLTGEDRLGDRHCPPQDGNLDWDRMASLRWRRPGRPRQRLRTRPRPASPGHWGHVIRLQISPITNPAMRPPRWACHEMVLNTKGMAALIRRRKTSWPSNALP